VTSPPSLLILQDANFGFSSNRFGFDFSAPEGQVVVVEGSQDLVTWAPLATNTVGCTHLFSATRYRVPTGVVSTACTVNETSN